MTEKQVIDKADELIEKSVQTMKARVRRAVKFGAVDFTDAPDNFRVPRIFLLDALNYATDQFCLAMSDKQGKKDVQNLSYF